MADAWWISGDYLENCNCEVLCPCLLGPRDARGARARGDRVNRHDGRNRR